MPLLIHAGTVVTCVERQHILHNQGVLLENGTIRAIDAWDSFVPDKDVEVVDASRHTILPGLIDAHIHITGSGEPNDQAQFFGLTELAATSALKAARHAQRHLDMGVTTVRVLGTMDWVDIALRDAINAGWHPGPRIVAAGPGITSTGGHADRRKALRGDMSPDIAKPSTIADSPFEARRVAWEILMRGADVIKIMATLSEYVRAQGGQCSPELTYDSMKEICDVAHGAGRKVAAHCHGGPGVDMAIDAGVDTFEHGRFLTDSQLARMAELGRFLVPTLSPEARRIDNHDTSGNAGDRRWFAMATEAMYDTVHRAYRHGVKVAAGTDVGMPHVRHGELGYEMFHMSKAGLSNLAVIEAATRVSAEACDLGTHLGQIRPEFAADLVIVDGNPIEDLRILQQRERVSMVIANGSIAVDRL